MRPSSRLQCTQAGDACTSDLCYFFTASCPRFSQPPKTKPCLSGFECLSHFCPPHLIVPMLSLLTMQFLNPGSAIRVAAASASPAPTRTWWVPFVSSLVDVFRDFMQKAIRVVAFFGQHARGGKLATDYSARFAAPKSRSQDKQKCT